jgi:hypothetical protein
MPSRYGLWICFILPFGTIAQTSLSGTNDPDTSAATGTASYVSYDSTIVVPSTAAMSSATANSASNSSTRETSSISGTLLVGGQATSAASLDGTALRNATSTSSSAQPTNTQPCNGHPEFCSRTFSNITMVAAHNSPFVVKNNAASNQALPVTTQLNDGIRMREYTLKYEPHQLLTCPQSTM